jgi:predicted nucleic acid-binding protein
VRASRLLIDDLPGRRAAERRSIPVTGTLTIAWQAALVSNLDFNLLLSKLLALGFRASDDVLDLVKHEYAAARAEHK